MEKLPNAISSAPNFQSGQTLIQVLIAIGIMAIMMSAFTTMIVNVTHENQALSEKVATLDTQSQLINVLSSGQICDFLLTNDGPWLPGTRPLTFDASTIGTLSSPSFELNSILSNPTNTSSLLYEVGKPLSAYAPRLTIQSIRITGLQGNSTDSRFPATLTISVDPGKLSRPIAPATAQINIVTTGAGSIKTITGCTRALAGARVSTTITQLHALHSSCGPLSGYKFFDSPFGSGSLSSGGLLHHCLTACSRYCRQLGYSGGTMPEYSESSGVAACDCIP